MIPLLSVRSLTVEAVGRQSRRTLVRSASFDVARGEAVAIVGESGSGKTLTALTVMGLLRAPNLEVSSGEVLFNGENLRTMDSAAFRLIRGDRLSMIYQDPMTSLNPLMRVGRQLTEALTIRGVDDKTAVARAREALVRVGIPDATRALGSYPHQFSGGMRQRIMIALALILEPDLLVADEPTTALDVTIQQQILALVQQEQRSRNMGLIWITHDLGVVAQLVDRVIVMYNGSIVEVAARADIFTRPAHPYTKALIGSIPMAGDPPHKRLVGIPMAKFAAPVGGCPFAPRCPRVSAACASMPETVEISPGHHVACFNPETSVA